jgi:inosine-uridine nucleoside N-ribohydrolase
MIFLTFFLLKELIMGLKFISTCFFFLIAANLRGQVIRDDNDHETPERNRPFRIIVDTDLRSDVDDAGALALVNALADNGECQLIGVIASQTGPSIVGAVNAINTWYGRQDVPVGLSPVDDLRFDDHYAPVIGNPENFPSGQGNKSAPESTALYRRLLKESPDKSVKIVVIGGQTPLRLLLESEADHEGDGSINKPGWELIKAKVKGLYLMAGNFENPDQAEHNIMLDKEASQFVAAHWPTPLVYSGFEIGRKVITGRAMTNPEENPVARAYQLFPTGGVGNIAGSSSYDQTILYYAVRGATAGNEQLWDISRPGTVRFPRGKTVFNAHPNGNCRYLIAKAPYEKVAEVIEKLMIQMPQVSD